MAELTWRHETRNIPQRRLEVRQEATAEERQAIAKSLSLAGLDRLTARYWIEPLSPGRHRVAGQIEADLVQSCVVTLDPVREALVEPFAVEFWPGDEIPDARPPGDAEALAPEPPEPIEDGQLDVGRIVFECLAAAINPYPRAPGAELSLDATGDGAPSDLGGNPFAALTRLKKGE